MSEKSLALKLIEEAIQNQSKFLDLGNCGLTDESPELKLLAECSFLEVLNLGISYFDQEGKSLKSKNKGERNQLRTIPLSLPPSLLNLSFYRNQITKIENLDKLTSLRQLNLRFNQISKIENLDKLHNLSQLNLSENKIAKIENLDKLHNLSKLILGGNQIAKIENLDHFSNLRQLHLWNNQITKIENFEKLPHLSQLGLGGNQIVKIENLDHLPNLRELELNYNLIQKIENLYKLTNLSQLELSGNRITKIENLDHLSHLNELDLSDNQIQDVSPLKAIIQQLQYLYLDDNPLENLNFQEFSNIQIWKDYFKSLEEKEDDQDKISYIKVNIIGDGRIGKTQFINYLNHKQPTHKEDETEGVQTVLHSLGDNTVNLWDFGGQNYYHGSHRIMIRPQDINLVMWSRFRKLSKTDEPFRGYNYWLGTAHAYSIEADKNDVFLLQSVWNDLTRVEYEKIDKNIDADNTAIVSELDMKDYKVCPDHIFALDVFSTKKGEKKWIRSWNNFLEIFQEHIVNKLDKRQKVSKKLIAVNEILIKYDEEKFIFTEDEFYTKFDLTASEIQDVIHYWLSVLEFTGAILYLKEIEGLKKKIILPPYKLSEFIHQKLNLDKTDRGKMTKTQMKKIFKEDTDDVLLIMEYFNLFFLDAKDKTIYVFPQYLSDENTAFKKALLDLVPYTFSLTFPDYFHEGRFFEFMSEYGQFAIDQSSYWKYGILFQKPDETGPPSENGTDNKNPKAIVYYDRLNMTITVHIEDKKGKAELAKELFYQFAYKEKIYIDELEPITTNGVILDIRETEVKYKKGRSHRDKILNYNFHRNLILSTSSNNKFDVKKTKESLNNKHYFGYNLVTERQEALDLMTLNLLDSGDKKKHRVFFSYSHKDEVYRDELEVHFANLKRSGYVETWHDRKILPGQDWDNKIKEQLENADIVLMLISPHFIHSDYIWNEELKIIKERKKNKDGIIDIPILLHPCDLEGLEIMDNQATPNDMRWIASSYWPYKHEAYLAVIKDIRKHFK